MVSEISKRCKYSAPLSIPMFGSWPAREVPHARGRLRRSWSAKTRMVPRMAWPRVRTNHDLRRANRCMPSIEIHEQERNGRHGMHKRSYIPYYTMTVPASKSCSQPLGAKAVCLTWFMFKYRKHRIALGRSLSPYFHIGTSKRTVNRACFVQLDWDL